jgi:hypothetical protein
MQYAKEVEKSVSALSRFVTAVRKTHQKLSKKTLSFCKSFSGFLFPVGSAARTCLCRSAFKGLKTLGERQRAPSWPPTYQQESAGRDRQHNARPEMMILRVPAQRAFFFQGLAAGDPLAGDHRRNSPASQPPWTAGTVRSFRG